MKSRILFVYPPSKSINREDRCQVPTGGVAVSPALPPVDLLYLAAIAERQDWKALIRDYTLENATIQDFKKDVYDFKPDIIFASTTTPTLAEDIAICSEIKRIFPEIKIVLKSAHFLKFNETVLKENPLIDILIRGEAELPLGKLLAGEPVEDICGVTARKGNSIAHNKNLEYVQNLDSLPFPARHLIDNSLYVRPDNSKPQAIIKVSRGCPFNCFFCLATPVSGSKLRIRSIVNILNEVRECMDKYGIRNFLFWSDTFNLDSQWLIRFCNRISSSGLKFKWSANARVDSVTAENAKAMKHAGCEVVSLGIESGNQEILNKMGKKTTVTQIREAFKILKKAGLKTFAYYIIGLPWDTRETVEDTISLAIELDSDYANFFAATAFPGTRFFDYAVENNLFDEKSPKNALYDNAYYMPTVAGHYLSRDEISRLHKRAVRKFFFRFKYIFRTMLKIRSFAELRNYLNAGLLLIVRH
jgi:radical SAM superfamily enzyme YgiQ (UPF0313 family)